MRRASTRARRGEGAFGLIVGLGVLFVVVVACVRIIPLHIHGNEVLDSLNEAANFGGLKSPEKLQYDVFMRAQNNKVPLKLEAIRVERTGQYIAISAKYEQSVDVLGYKYVYKFDKRVEKPVF
jgi:hypothetical protein